MSGFICIVHFDGRSADPELLASLTESLAFRRPDGQGQWLDGPVGLGVAKFAATDEAQREQQPLSLDGEVWIVADARIDRRRELSTELQRHLAEELRDATDAELILHAYRVWQEQATEHLLGDFSFAIWDRRRQRLFCARDHFGVRPLYYAEGDGQVAISNSLSCLRRHPAVSSELNEQAIADYLLFGMNYDPTTTTFTDVRRLPAAHSQTWTLGRCDHRRYWRLSTEASSPAEPEGGWVERFRELFRVAVEDRLRTGSVGVLMSGGLDSTAVAATAQRIYVERGLRDRVRSYTGGYDRLIADREPYYAQLAADHLAMPHHYHAMDDYRVAERRDQAPQAPEPGEVVFGAAQYDSDRLISSRHRVLLTGHGGDPLLMSSKGYLFRQLRRGRLDQAVRYLGGSLNRERRLPPLGLHTWWLRRRRRRRWREGYPRWLDRTFETRCDLEGRWRGLLCQQSPELHPTRPEAHHVLEDVMWANMFECLVPDHGCFAIEVRHPFFDLRLVEFLLAMPPVPWCLDKHLLREAMRGVLPEPIRRRPKSPLVGFPQHPSVHPASSIWHGLARRVPAVARYVDPYKVREELLNYERAGGDTPPFGDEIYRAFNLGFWLERAGLGKETWS